MKTSINKKQKIEVASVFNACIEQIGGQQNLCRTQLRALSDITACRTVDMGGHINACNHCELKQQAYNSCHNRHCPKCQFLKQE